MKKVKGIESQSAPYWEGPYEIASRKPTGGAGNPMGKIRAGKDLSEN